MSGRTPNARTRGAALTMAVMACLHAAAAGAGARDTAWRQPAGAAGIVADFVERCEVYVTLHKKLEGGLPPLSKDSTPQQIEEAQQRLSALITGARRGAKAGELFTPPVQAYLRQVLAEVLARPEGRQLRASILDENRANVAVRVNGRYPDGVPLATTPPQVLDALPKLPEELEYRFVGERLILYDHHAHLVVDYLDRALPRV